MSSSKQRSSSLPVLSSSSNSVVAFKTIKFEHYYVDVKDEDQKIETLRSLYDSIIHDVKSVIYVNNGRTLDKVVDMMRFYKHKIFRASDINNPMDMSEFYAGRSGALITTEPMAARIDLTYIPVIVNYDIPDCDLLQYMTRVRRIGVRKGLRIGGWVINIVTPDTMANVSDIQKCFNVVINKLPTDGSLAILP